MRLVLDSSIAGCWCFPDEVGTVADAAWDRLQAGGASVPALRAELAPRACSRPIRWRAS